jgi:hypothetical protein
MSAMPIRAPRTTAMPRTRKHLKLVKQATAPMMAPIAEAMPLRLPQGQASTKRFTYIVMGIMGFGMLASLLVNILSAQASITKQSLQTQLSNLVSQQQSLERTVISTESPENLVRAAYRMGMVPAGSPAFIRLSDRKIIGTPMAASSQGR